ncbi:MAG: lysine 2,3-aminomutase [Spirochaetaceae bacterium]|nr:MAG: lysine 2,3-aminomutase [Spirochaetaceae bacterium]
MVYQGGILSRHTTNTPKFRAFNERNFEQLSGFSNLSADDRFAIQVVSRVFPFRVNSYVADELIDWSHIPNDPMYQLTVPQPGMLSTEDFDKVANLLRQDAPKETLASTVLAIRTKLNPHPAGQVSLNVPQLSGERLPGLQHKYRETVLFFPQAGQTCHAYCTFCFRWPQFLTDSEVRFSAPDSDGLVRYLAQHPEVTDLLFTGGDPLIMNTRLFERYINPILNADPPMLETIRIGTKALGYWPYRFVTDPDADDLLRLMERVIATGRHLAVMAHFNHPREMEPPIVQEAIARIRNTGAQIRTQSPLVKHINDSTEVWRKLWRKQVNLGLVPYYMFVERDTGASHYFRVPLARAWDIYRGAITSISGLGRTARGPSMSANPGKVEIQGITWINGEKVFVLRFIQGRNPEWVQRPFFAKYDPEAAWLTELKPAFGEKEFFFEQEMREIASQSERQYDEDEEEDQ